MQTSDDSKLQTSDYSKTCRQCNVRSFETIGVLLLIASQIPLLWVRTGNFKNQYPEASLDMWDVEDRHSNSDSFQILLRCGTKLLNSSKISTKPHQNNRARFA